MRKVMIPILVMAVSALTVLSAACDKPYEKQQSPYAETGITPEAPQTDFQKKTYADKTELMEIYWYTFETYKEVQGIVDKMAKSQDDDEADFNAALAEFKERMIVWDRMIDLRIERFRANPMQLPPEHPRYKMERALNLLRDLINDYARHYLQKAPLNPDLQKEFDDLMEKGKQDLDKM